MVASRKNSKDELQIILRANQSASWRTNLLVWGVLSAAALAIATAFASIGAPIVLPFVGIEVVVLIVAFYKVSRDSSRQQVIRINRQNLIIEKGHRRLEQVLNLPKHWVRVTVERDERPLGIDHLFLCCKAQRCPVGEFLSQQEVEQLLNSLRQQGFPMRIESM